MSPRTVLGIALAVATATASSAGPDAPAAPLPTYRNAELGLTIEGPKGWSVVPDPGGPVVWQRLCSFSEAAYGTLVSVAARRAKTSDVAQLRADVQREYAADKSFTVTAVTDVSPTPERAVTGVVVDATQTRPGDVPVPAPPPGTPAPPPVVYRVRAAYLLAQGMEYLIYAQVKSIHFVRVQADLDRLIAGFRLKGAVATSAVPKGENAFRDDTAGYACRFPAGYSVRLPDREQHLVEFAPADDGPVIGIYRFPSGADLESEGKTLVQYYTGDEVGGSAESRSAEVGGHSAVVVTARGNVGGRDQVFFVAALKRGDEIFRVRVNASKASEARAKEVFDAFLRTFVLTNA